MKIAIMMHGLAGCVNKYGTGGDVDVALSHKHFLKNIVQANPDDQIDVFMHSWSLDQEDALRELYSPVSALFERQIHFDLTYMVGDPNKPMNAGKTENGIFRGVENLRFHSLFSRWYSAQAVNKLRQLHEDELGSCYDIVMLTRFDLAYNVPIVFKDLDPNKLHVIPPLSHHGVQDLFFISGPQLCNHLCRLFDELVQIKHFPHWGVHSHFLVRRLIERDVGLQNLAFIGPERPWDAGTAGAKLGPAPCVRDFYDLHAVQDGDPNSLDWVEAVKQEIYTSSPRYSEISHG